MQAAERRPSLRRLPVVVSAVLLTLSPVSPASAQQLFRLYGWHGQLGGLFELEHEDLSGNTSSTKTRRFVFQERLSLRTQGSIVHPDLLFFTAGGQVGAVQDELRSKAAGTTVTQPGDELLYGYDGVLSLLRTHPYNLDLFASRAETSVRRDFVGRTDLTAERFGSTIRATELPLPSSITLQEQHVRQRPVGDPVQQDETRRSAIYRGRRRWDTSDVTADYRFEDVKDDVRPGGNFNLHIGGFSHVWRLSPDRSRVLFSTARVFARDGTSDSSTVTDTETLRWQLTPNLWSDYNYSFAHSDSDGSAVTTHRGSVGLGHHWYQSLTTSLHAETVFVEFEQGNEKDYGGGLGWSYTKRIPWNGRLGLNLAWSYLLADRDVPPGVLSVLDERQTFTDAGPVLLENRNVVASTIVVTSEDGTIVFARGTDYFVEELGRRIEIRRNPLGRIQAGETVLLSYESEIGGPFRIGNRPLSFGTSADFGWVHVFYAGERLRQDVFDGDPEVTLGSIDTDTAGIEFRQRGERLDLAAGQEYRRYRSDELRFQSVGFTQTAAWRISPFLRLELLGNEIFHTFDEPDRTRNFFSGRTSLTWRPLANLTAVVFAGIREQQESDIPDETFVEAGTDMRWILGHFTVHLSYEYNSRDIGASERTGDLTRLELTRSF